MTFFNVISLLGGLGMFLYGMSVMGSSLEKVAGGKAEGLLHRLTSSPLKGVLLGTIITSVIQSSSATTVIVIGLVNSGLMAFAQSVAVIMGANIGTTVTGQIIRLSDLDGESLLLQLVKPSTLAPAAILVGVIFFLFCKATKKRNVGHILLGFGILFTGMLAMEAAVVPLRDAPWFAQLFSGLQNPILGLLAGFVVTSIIQSSSASLGILQALTVTGVVSWGSAIPIILGQNIGTCITGVLASIGASRAAKRVAYSHVFFNVLGTGLFLVLIYGFRALFGAPFWGDAVDMGGIANFHTVFNIGTTLILLPCRNLFVRLCNRLIPERREETHPELAEVVLDTRLYASPAMAIAQAHAAVVQMAGLARLIQRSAIAIMLGEVPAEAVKLATKREELTDRLEVSVTNYLVGIARLDLSEQESRRTADLLAFVSEFERIGDRSVNVMERNGEVRDKDLVFSETARQSFDLLDRALGEVCDLAIEAFSNGDLMSAVKVEPLEQTIDRICDAARTRHIARLKEGLCSIEAGVVFLEVLNNYERISDHCSNVAARLISNSEAVPDPHTLLRRLHEGQEEPYAKLAEYYGEKYTLPSE
ncbi:MAG: Na/Pi cotransporter family protein [Oscillospiraceae bacterium]|jgi:phosphate:Na+ symporter|nr:Na/Pi cotransporter family protein [Oscillospiraceae bacterium]